MPDRLLGVDHHVQYASGGRHDGPLPSTSSTSTASTTADSVQRRQGYVPAKTPEVMHEKRFGDLQHYQYPAAVATGSASSHSHNSTGSMSMSGNGNNVGGGGGGSPSMHFRGASLGNGSGNRNKHEQHRHYSTNSNGTNDNAAAMMGSTSTSARSGSISGSLERGFGPGSYAGVGAGGQQQQPSSYLATPMLKSISNTSSVGYGSVFDSYDSPNSSPMVAQGSAMSMSTAATTPSASPPNKLPFQKKHSVIPSLSSMLPPVTSSIRKTRGMTLASTPASASTLATSMPAMPWTDSPQAWMVYYFVANLSLTLYNKLLMNKFPFPWALTGVHTLCGAIGSQICLSRGVFVQQRLTSHENLVLLAFSSLYTVNIAVSNLSLNLVTVPFHQVVLAMTPLFTVVLSTVFLKKSSSRATYLSLVPVVLGVVFATYGDYYFTTWGLILTLLGTVLAAMKTITTNIILVGRLKLHPLDLLIRMSPLAFIQCVVASWYTGELDKVREYGATQMDRNRAIGLLINGTIAFALNVVSFTANKKTSPLSMTVAANVKQVLTIVLAVLIFHLHINATNLFGISLTLFGGAWYAKVEYDNKLQKQRQVATMGSVVANGGGATAMNGAPGPQSKRNREWEKAQESARSAGGHSGHPYHHGHHHDEASVPLMGITEEKRHFVR